MQAFEASLAQKDGVWGLVAVRYLGELHLKDCVQVALAAQVQLPLAANVEITQ